MNNLIELVGKELEPNKQDISSWSGENHTEDLRSFISQYMIQQSKQINNPQTEAICGEDNREEIKEVNIDSHVHYRATCHLAVTYEDGKLGASSGFFIAPRKVVTAGHCIYKSAHGYARKVIIRPGLHRRPNGEIHVPFLGDVAGDVRVPKAWEEREDYNFDWGLITLATEDLYNRAGRPAFTLWAPTDEVIRNNTFISYGYPDRCSPNMCLYYSRAPESIAEITRYILYSRHDVTKGNSGGPLVLNGDIRVASICSHEFDQTCSEPNGFTRVTAHVKRTIEEYVWP